LRTATWAIGFGCLGMLPLALPRSQQFDPLTSVWAPWVSWPYCALLPAAAANVVVFAAIKVLGPTRVMFFQFLVPAFAVIMAAFFLGEAIVLGQVLGGLVIVLGILVAGLAGFAAAVG
jgi:drug/metabolite transporter (DMT)-like permease